MHHLGDCPVCGQLCRLRKDGTVGRHYPVSAHRRWTIKDSLECAGEGRTPVRHEGSSTVAIELAKLEG